MGDDLNSEEPANLFKIINKVIKNIEPRYSAMTNGNIEYNWETIIMDIKMAVKSNPSCLKECKADGSSIFHVVAEHSDILDGRILIFLLDKYPDGVKLKNKFGLLPVHKAVMQNDTDVEELEILIKAHPECLYETNVEGQCPLHLAVVGSKVSYDTVIYLLCEAIDSAKIVDKYGHLPLHKAVAIKHPV